MAIRFEVSQPGHPAHEVELAGTVAVIGRDPTCDLVVGDSKCSRRHAVVEDGPGGLVVRDAGSANGVFVNGQRRNRATLHPGDTVRVGDVSLRVLPTTEETVVLAPSDVEAGPLLPPADPALVPAPVAAPGHDPRVSTAPGSTQRSRAWPPDPARRPPTVTLLAVLWALCAPGWVGGGILFAVRGGLEVTGSILAALAGLVLGIACAVVAVGLAMRAAWARTAQIAAAAVGLLACPFTFASVTVLLYMLRPDVRATFAGDGEDGGTGAGTAETTFALSLLGMLALGVVLALVARFALAPR
jgi:hypothetical protein